MAKGQTFDLATYQARKADLAISLREAEEQYRRAALDCTLGKLSQAEVDARALALSGLQSRARELDEAWRQVQAAADRERKLNEAEVRQHVYERVGEVVKQRGETLQAIAAKAPELGTLVREYDKLSDDIRQLLRPYVKDIGAGDNDAFSDLVRDLLERDQEAYLLGGVFFAEKIWGLGSLDAKSRVADGGLERFIEMRTRVILSAADKILPPDHDDQQEAA